VPPPERTTVFELGFFESDTMLATPVSLWAADAIAAEDIDGPMVSARAPPPSGAAFADVAAPELSVLVVLNRRAAGLGPV
jgi:hypothetical protein